MLIYRSTQKKKRRSKSVLKHNAHFPFVLGTTTCPFASLRKEVAVLWRLRAQTVEGVKKLNSPELTKACRGQDSVRSCTAPLLLPAT